MAAPPTVTAVLPVTFWPMPPPITASYLPAFRIISALSTVWFQEPPMARRFEPEVSLLQMLPLVSMVTSLSISSR